MSDFFSSREKEREFYRKPQWYVLDTNHEPVAVTDLAEWARFFENAEARRVAGTRLNGLYVSTVFLGLDHGWRQGRPILFETMIFRDEKNPANPEPAISLEQIEAWREGYQTRYASWAEAEAGHAMVVTMIREGLF
jgi:hypothetical protein